MGQKPIEGSNPSLSAKFNPARDAGRIEFDRERGSIRTLRFDRLPEEVGDARSAPRRGKKKRDFVFLAHPSSTETTRSRHRATARRSCTADRKPRQAGAKKGESSPFSRIVSRPNRHGYRPTPATRRRIRDIRTEMDREPEAPVAAPSAEGNGGFRLDGVSRFRSRPGPDRPVPAVCAGKSLRDGPRLPSVR